MAFDTQYLPAVFQLYEVQRRLFGSHTTLPVSSSSSPSSLSPSSTSFSILKRSQKVRLMRVNSFWAAMIGPFVYESLVLLKFHWGVSPSTDCLIRYGHWIRELVLEDNYQARRLAGSDSNIKELKRLKFQSMPAGTPSPAGPRGDEVEQVGLNDETDGNSVATGGGGGVVGVKIGYAMTIVRNNPKLEYLEINFDYSPTTTRYLTDVVQTLKWLTELVLKNVSFDPLVLETMLQKMSTENGTRLRKVSLQKCIFNQGLLHTRSATETTETTVGSENTIAANEQRLYLPNKLQSLDCIAREVDPAYQTDVSWTVLQSSPELKSLTLENIPPLMVIHLHQYLEECSRYDFSSLSVPVLYDLPKGTKPKTSTFLTPILKNLESFSLLLKSTTHWNRYAAILNDKAMSLLLQHLLLIGGTSNDSEKDEGASSNGANQRITGNSPKLQKLKFGRTSLGKLCIPVLIKVAKLTADTTTAISGITHLELEKCWRLKSKDVQLLLCSFNRLESFSACQESVLLDVGVLLNGGCGPSESSSKLLCNDRDDKVVAGNEQEQQHGESDTGSHVAIDNNSNKTNKADNTLRTNTSTASTILPEYWACSSTLKSLKLCVWTMSCVPTPGDFSTDVITATSPDIISEHSLVNTTLIPQLCQLSKLVLLDLTLLLRTTPDDWSMAQRQRQLQIQRQQGVEESYRISFFETVMKSCRALERMSILTNRTIVDYNVECDWNDGLKTRRARSQTEQGGETMDNRAMAYICTDVRTSLLREESADMYSEDD